VRRTVAVEAARAMPVDELFGCCLIHDRSCS
jgi:hypothetical protein